MPILNKNNNVEVENYKNFLSNNNACAMQDIMWSKVKPLWKSEVVYIEDNNEIIAACHILFEKVPLFNSHLMYISKGPVCDMYNIDLVNKLLLECDELIKKYKVFLCILDPEVKYDSKLFKLYTDNGYIVSDTKGNIQPINNMVLNIKDKSIDELFKSFSEKTRYNIRLATKKNVKVRYSNNEEDLKIFYELYKTTTIRDKIGCRPYNYFLNMLNAFKNNIRIYISSHDDDNLSAAIALKYTNKLFYIYGASSNEKRNLMPNYLMQFEMIKWAKECNLDLYDFGGVKVLSNDNGLYKFKIGFCKVDGVTSYIGEIHKVYNKSIYFIYIYILPVITKLKKLFRK
ncbi:MAG: peptidoglycan bridge formation glycyltransferase FemA/FemB family protein [Clostridia bacterium]